MILKRVTENQTQGTLSNLVFKTTQNFIRGSVEITDGTAAVTATELSDNIIKLSSPVPIGTTLYISYNVQVSSYDSDIDITQRLRALEETCERLQKQNDLLLAAVKDRVPVKTFRQWLLVMEKNYGKSVLDSNSLLGIQGESIPNEWKL